MRLFKYFPLSLLLFITDYSTPAQANLVPRAIQRAHKFAAKQTHNLAKDLRLAFGGVLVPRDDTSAPLAQRVVYCKTKQAPFNAGPTGGSNVTSMTAGGSSTKGYPPSNVPGTKTATSGQPSATGVVPDSPWKLQQSYVRVLILPFGVGGVAIDCWVQDGNSFFQGWDFFMGNDPTSGGFSINSII